MPSNQGNEKYNIEEEEKDDANLCLKFFLGKI